MADGDDFFAVIEDFYGIYHHRDEE
jgi:hypothetical protein